MQHAHIKVQTRGRLAIPVDYRKALNLTSGDEIMLRLEEDRALVISACKKDSKIKSKRPKKK